MRNPLPWSISFAVGHEVIDRQHREIVALINEVTEIARGEKDPGRL